MTGWSRPINLGASINSAGFDAYFATYPNGSTYLVSNRESKLSDLYSCSEVAKKRPKPSIALEEKNIAPLTAPLVNAVETMRSDLASTGQAAPEFVYFETNAVQLTDSAKQTLNLLIEVIRQDPSVGIELRGYSDNLGSAAYNLKLSKMRSESVKEYLIEKGVKAKNVITVGVGVGSPLASNDTEEGRAKKRRVRLILHTL